MISLYPRCLRVLILAAPAALALSISLAQAQPPVVHPPQPPRRVQNSAPAETQPALQFTIPEGTPLAVRFVDTISSTTHTTGAIFQGILDQDIKLEDRVVIPRGTRVFGEVTESLPGGRVKGRAQLTVALREVEIDGSRESIETNEITVVAAGTKSEDTKKVGIAAGIGAIIGAIAGGKKGAAIGATIGGAAQAGRVLSSRGDAAEIERERLLSFRLEEPFEYPEG